MKKLAVAVGTSVLLLGAGFAVAKDRTFKGEIMDSECAKEGSHDAMMKKAAEHERLGEKDKALEIYRAVAGMFADAAEGGEYSEHALRAFKEIRRLTK